MPLANNSIYTPASVFYTAKQHLHALAAKQATRRLKMRVLAALSSSEGAVLFLCKQQFTKISVFFLLDYSKKKLYLEHKQLTINHKR